MKRLLIATVLSASLISPSFAAIEIDETQPFGPTYGSTVADVTIGKPLQLAGAIIGTALHVVTYPFAMASNSVEQTHATLVEGPWNALQRCNGCTPAYENYQNSKKDTANQVRFVVDGPSEIIIQSDGRVNVNK